MLMYDVLNGLHKMAMSLAALWNANARRWLQGVRNTSKNIQDAFTQNEQPTVWMHCFSGGEFEQGLPVLEQLQAQYPAYCYLVSFSSLATYTLKKKSPLRATLLCLPVDSKKNAAELCNAAKPVLVLWMRSPCWLYYLEEINRRKIPLLLLSANFRPGQRIFKWHGALQRSMLNCFTHLFVQNTLSAKLLKEYGLLNDTTVSGDTRFDRVIAIAAMAGSIPLIEEFCKNASTVIVAGNTWEEDEEQLDHYANTHPEIKFVIVPHEADADRIKDMRKLFRRMVCYSDLLADEQISVPRTVSKMNQDVEPNVLVIDQNGMLPFLYRYATVAYIGGGFVGSGVHNVPEAAVYGKPVIYGPVIDNNSEAMDLVECGGGIVTDSALELESTLNRLLKSADEYKARCEAAAHDVYSKKGATEKILGYIQEKRLLTN